MINNGFLFGVSGNIYTYSASKHAIYVKQHMHLADTTMNAPAVAHENKTHLHKQQTIGCGSNYCIHSAYVLYYSHIIDQHLMSDRIIS